MKKTFGNRLVLAVLLGLFGSEATVCRAEEVCADLRQAERELAARKAAILRKYPGTAASLFLCGTVASEQPEADRVSTFLGCGALACVSIGFNNCLDLAGEVIALSMAEEKLRQQMAEAGC